MNKQRIIDTIEEWKPSKSYPVTYALYSVTFVDINGDETKMSLVARYPELPGEDEELDKAFATYGCEALNKQCDVSYYTLGTYGLRGLQR